MKKTILFAALLVVSLIANAQQLKPVQKFYAEGEYMIRNFKIHSTDSCTAIKNMYFDDQTQCLSIDSDNRTISNISPYDRLEDSRIFFCDRCMNQALITEFKSRMKKYLQTHKSPY